MLRPENDMQQFLVGLAKQMRCQKWYSLLFWGQGVDEKLYYATALLLKAETGGMT